MACCNIYFVLVACLSFFIGIAKYHEGFHDMFQDMMDKLDNLPTIKTEANLILNESIHFQTEVRE